MLIQRDDVIARRPAVEVRSALQRLRFHEFSVAGAAARLRCSTTEAASLLDDLLAEGFIEPARTTMSAVIGPDEEWGGVQLYAVPIRGQALAKARIGKPITRTQAQRLVDGVIERVHAVNADADWLYLVTDLVLFGSFSRSGTDPVGDVDLACDLCPREMTEREWESRVDEIAKREGKRFPSFTERIFYPGRRVRKFLRGSSTRVDLVEFSRGDGIPPGSEPVVLFRHEP